MPPKDSARKPVSVLIIDDDEMSLEVLSEMIEELDYEVHRANTGKKGFEIYAENSSEIALVLLDMVMPDLDCETVFLGLRKINPECKVLLSTGMDMNDEAENMLELGCEGYIQKPCSLEELEKKIRSIIEG